VDLPGHGASPTPLADTPDDAQCVADALAAIDGPVVLVGHSYGGVVISEAALLHPDNVDHLVYLTAFCLDEGEALFPFTQEHPPPAPSPIVQGIRPTEDGFIDIDADVCVPAFYGNCEPEVAAAAIARLCRQRLSTFQHPVSGTPWKTIPSTYVRCTLDGAIDITTQDAMAQRCGNIASLDTDHSPFASMPKETADIIEPLARP